MYFFFGGNLLPAIYRQFIINVYICTPERGKLPKMKEPSARMAESVDALVSNTNGRKAVSVRSRLRVRSKTPKELKNNSLGVLIFRPRQHHASKSSFSQKQSVLRERFWMDIYHYPRTALFRNDCTDGDNIPSRLVSMRPFATSPMRYSRNIGSGK